MKRESIMCLKKRVNMQSAYFPPGVVDGVVGIFVGRTPPITLDQIFELNVLKPTTSEEFEYYTTSSKQIQKELLFDVVVLDESTRGDFNILSNKFWGPSTSSGNAVSKYYHRGFDRRSEYMLEPCTGVVGSHVLLCIELFFNRSNHLVYRDIMTTINTSLGEALADFNMVLGLPVSVSYSYTRHTEEDRCEIVAIPECMLAMSLKDVLRNASIQNSNDSDYFRLSPQDVEESESHGNFTCTKYFQRVE